MEVKFELIRTRGMATWKAPEPFAQPLALGDSAHRISEQCNRVFHG